MCLDAYDVFFHYIMKSYLHCKKRKKKKNQKKKAKKKTDIKDVFIFVFLRNINSYETYSSLWFLKKKKPET